MTNQLALSALATSLCSKEMSGNEPAKTSIYLPGYDEGLDDLQEGEPRPERSRTMPWAWLSTECDTTGHHHVLQVRMTQ
jgi:hypothetical protein